MSIKFACECGKAYKVPEKFAGKRVKCKQCGEPIRVPSESQAGVTSTRATSVSQRSVLASQRVDRRSSRRRRSSEESARKSSRGRASSTSSRRASTRVSGEIKTALPGAKTERFKPIDLTKGNIVKDYKSKRDEEFSRGQGRLTYFEDGKPVKAFRITKKEYYVGRSESCSICLPLASISRQHLKIEYKLGTFIVTDLSSTNGLVVNGRSVRRASLGSGDILQLGQAILRIDC